MTTMFSEEELQPLKELLFGLQKQANVQNDAVVRIIAQELFEKAGVKSFACNNLCDRIKEYIMNCCHGNTQPNETALLLLVGEKSFQCYKNADIKGVDATYPNPESPKCVFKITSINPDDIQHITGTVNRLNALHGKYSTPEMQEKKERIMETINSNPRFRAIMLDESPECPGGTKSEKIRYIIQNYPDFFKETESDTKIKYVQAKSRTQLNVPINADTAEETLYERACKIRDNIFQTAPASVKNAIPNDTWAVAMYCAPYYYGVK